MKEILYESNMNTINNQTNKTRNMRYDIDLTRYSERISSLEQTINDVYEFKNSNLPFIVNYVNYWLDGENPGLIPDNYFTNPAAQTKFQVDKINHHLQSLNDAYIPFLHPWFGTVVLPSALGCEIAMNPRKDPAVKTNVIQHPEEITKLKLPDFDHDGLLPDVLSTIDFMVSNSNIPVSITDAQGPLNIALNLCGVENLFVWMYTNPNEVHEIMEFCTEALIKWIKVQKEHLKPDMRQVTWPHGILLPENYGSVWLADDDCTQLSAELYKEFVVPYNSKVFKAFNGGTLHFCGTAEHQLENFLQTEGLVGVNNFCMGNFLQVKKMQDLYKNKLAIMVCDFAPVNYEDYYTELLGFLEPKGTILACFIAPKYSLQNGQYETTDYNGKYRSLQLYNFLNKALNS